ncbi:AIM24 family protein, partial [Jatrophihabitans sp. YIM 134969]
APFQPAAAFQQPAPTAGPPAGGGHGPVPGGIRGDLVDGRFAGGQTPGPALQNPKLLRVRLTEPFLAKQGAMVAYQGQLAFHYQGAGMGRVLKRALTGEGLALMRVEGAGDCYLADRAKHVHLLQVDGGISVNGKNVLAFSQSLEWNVERVKGAAMASGGLFNTTLRGSGWLAIVTDGEPVVLDAGTAPTFADTDAIVAWSADLQTSLHSTMSAGALIGRGSGEAVQVVFQGRGFVIVQPSETVNTPGA